MDDGALLGKLFPEKNTDILLQKAGSLARLFGMSETELMRLGADEKTAEAITALPELSRRYFAQVNETVAMLTTPEEAQDYLKTYFTGLTEEKLFICCLNGRAEVIDVFDAGSGSEDAVSFDIPDITAQLLRCDAKGVILAHNHPGGFAVPSKQDLIMTKDLTYLLADLNITVCDHIIFAGNDSCCISTYPGTEFLMWNNK